MPIGSYMDHDKHTSEADKEGGVACARTCRMTSAKLMASSMPGMDPARSDRKEASPSSTPPAASRAFSGLGSTSYRVK
jgi:hypothetical protein